MPLFPSYRRFWCLFAATLLFIPLIAHLFSKQETRSTAEGRILSPPPAIPNSLAGIRELPRKTDAFLKDHYGLREPIVFANALIRYALRSPTHPNVFYGRDGWLFFTGDQTLQQMTHSQPRLAILDEFVNLLATINALLQREGRMLVVAIPPNKESIYSDELPEWLQNKAGPTEYDLMLKKLQDHQLRTVDLKRILREAAIKNYEPIYFRTDTHWNSFGALFAYNALVKAAGKDDWILNPKDVFIKESTGGDLARFLGLSGYLKDKSPYIPLPKTQKTVSLAPEEVNKEIPNSYILEQQHPGPTVLLIGDSFSRNLFNQFFSSHVGRLIWTPHRRCGFDWSLITRYQPDVVFYLPVERNIGCTPGVRPQGMDAWLFEASTASVLKIAGFEDAGKITSISQFAIATQAGENNTLILHSTGMDPHMQLPLFGTNPDKKFILRIELESPISTRLELYYMTETQKNFNKDQKASWNLTQGNNIVYLTFPHVNEKIYGDVRLDIGSSPGTFLVRNIEIRVIE